MLPDRIALAARHSPQGLRRPRFSFFIFTCQTARRSGPRSFRSKSCSPPSVAGSLEPGCPAAQPIHRTKNDNRQLIGCSSLITMRSLRGAEMCQGHLVQTKGPSTAALDGRVIGFPKSRCQRPFIKIFRENLVKNPARNLARKSGAPAGIPRAAFMHVAALEPQSCDVLNKLLNVNRVLSEDSNHRIAILAPPCAAKLGKFAQTVCHGPRC